MKEKYYEYLPEVIVNKVEELASSCKNPDIRFDRYLKIVGTIYRKCKKKHSYAHVPHPLAKNYWIKVIGHYYQTYMKELLAVGIVEKTPKGRKMYYNISLNILMQYSEIVKADYKAVDPNKNNKSDGLENRLRNRIIHDLEDISVNHELFIDSLDNGEFTIDPDEYLMDISDFPTDMRFDAEVHYPTSIYHHSHRVKELISIAKEEGLPIFYDKSKIRIMTKQKFKAMKQYSLISHSKLNLMKIMDGNFELSRNNNKTRRVFHACVSLSSKAMRYLMINGETMVGIDARTSQFLLLANLFKSFVTNSIADNFSDKRKTFIKELHNVFSDNQSEDYFAEVDRFYDDVINKDFYEVIQKTLGLNTRGQAKIFCFNIIFSKPDSKHKFKKKIRDRYPTIIDTLDAYKRMEMDGWVKRNNRLKKEDRKKKNKGYSALSINLQSLESEIFVDGIYNQLHAVGISCFTKHDSVIVPNGMKQQALKIAEDHYKTLEIVSKFKKEYYDPPVVQEELPDELEFVNDIGCKEDLRNLESDKLYTLLEHGSVLDKNQYDSLESMVIENDKNQLLLDDDSIEQLNDIVNNITSIYC